MKKSMYVLLIALGLGFIGYAVFQNATFARDPVSQTTTSTPCPSPSPSDTLSLPCDTSVSKTIFENEGDEKLIAVVTVTDKCVSFNSKLTLVKQNRDGSITPLKDKAVPDGETRSIAFSVKPGEAITLDCNGERGECTYSLTFPGTKK